MLKKSVRVCVSVQLFNKSDFHKRKLFAERTTTTQWP